MSDDRDLEIAGALATLEVPEHGGRFWADLDARLAAVAQPALPDSYVDDRDDIRPIDRRQRRRRPLFLTGLSAAAIIAALVAAVVVFRATDHPDDSGPASVNAAEEVVSVRGVVVWASPESPEARATFVLTADGSFRVSSPTLSGEAAFDMASGEYRGISPSDDPNRPFVVRLIGTAPGPPDDHHVARPPIPRDIAAFTAALVAAGDPRVTEGEFDGRAVWVLETDVEPYLLEEPTHDHVRAVIDRQTGLPLEVVEMNDGETHLTMRIVDLDVNPTIPADAFTLELPEEQERVDDYGFRRVELADVEAVTGYRPVVPTALPPGFELAGVWVSERGSRTGSEGVNPISEDVVQLVYRRGLRQIVVTTRRATQEAGSEWHDPFGAEGFVFAVQYTTVDAGAMAGTDVEVVIDPNTVPHLWGEGDELVLTVAGDIGEGDLIRIAESLSR